MERNKTCSLSAVHVYQHILERELPGNALATPPDNYFPQTNLSKQKNVDGENYFKVVSHIFTFCADVGRQKAAGFCLNFVTHLFLPLTRLSGAFGYFEVTDDITKYCKAKIFSEVGKRTPLAVRFSTVGQ